MRLLMYDSKLADSSNHFWSLKQGVKYEGPESAKNILTFIEFHGLKVYEILEPLDSFSELTSCRILLWPRLNTPKTFNEMWHRFAIPWFPSIIQPYRKLSIRELSRLLGDAYKGQADKYTGGALAIFRLAPQDYHHFHSPVEGKIGPMVYIAGEYYTANVSSARIVTQINWFLLASSYSYGSWCLLREYAKDRSHLQQAVVIFEVAGITDVEAELLIYANK